MERSQIYMGLVAAALAAMLISAIPANADQVVNTNPEKAFTLIPSLFDGNAFELGVTPVRFGWGGGVYIGGGPGFYGGGGNYFDQYYYGYPSGPPVSGGGTGYFQRGNETCTWTGYEYKCYTTRYKY
jgi:hypothetical protein